MTAYELARGRRVLPTSLGTAGIREALPPAIRARAVFSARTTSADYVVELKSVIEAYLSGDLSKPAARALLKEKLAALGYDPEKGFRGDRAKGVPPARKGSLQDLGSNRRLNLILDTQWRLWAGKAQEVAGNTPEALFAAPYWELYRAGSVRVPRDWIERWQKVGGTVGDAGRLLALKTSGIWEKLGSSDHFPDALDTTCEPYAFGSKMRRKPVRRAAAARLGLPLPSAPARDLSPGEVAEALPGPEFVIPEGEKGRIKQKVAEMLQARMEEKAGKRRAIFDEALTETVKRQWPEQTRRGEETRKRTRDLAELAKKAAAVAGLKGDWILTVNDSAEMRETFGAWPQQRISRQRGIRTGALYGELIVRKGGRP